MEQGPNTTKTSAHADDATVVRAKDAPASGSLTAKEVRLAFLVKRNPGDSATPLTWSADVPVVHMLADLLAASGASPAGETNEFLDATAPDALKGLILASRAHRLAEAYATHPGADLQSLAVAILPVFGKKDAAKDAATRSALRQARPGQTLVLPEIQKAVESTPALQFRRVITPGSNRMEFLELISASGRRNTAEHAMQTVVAPTVTQAVNASTPMPSRPVAPAPSGPVVTHRKSSHVQEPKPGNKMPMVYGGAAAAVVLAVVGFMAFKPKAAEPEKAPVATPSPVVTSAPAVVPKTAPVKPDANSARKAAPPPPETKAAPAREEKRKAEAAQTSEAAAPPPPPPSSSGGGGFSADQINQILDTADTLSANAQYDAAIKKYDAVLHAEPGNSRARAGKARALNNKELQ